MLASLLIVFREVFEAGLVVGIVLAATEGVPLRGAWIASGIGCGIAGAGLLAAFAGALSRTVAGNGQEVFTASVLGIAVVMLGWHQLWMANHGREIARQMKELGAAVALGRKSLMAMAVVVAVAVLREGAEVVLFLYGIAVSSNEGFGRCLSAVCSASPRFAVAYLLYRGLVAIPVARLFTVTSWLIALLAAGMAGQAAATLAGADSDPKLGLRALGHVLAASRGHDYPAGRCTRCRLHGSPHGRAARCLCRRAAVLLLGGRLVARGSPSGRTKSRAAVLH